MKEKKFTWNRWRIDGDTDTIVIAKSEVQNKEDVADYIIEAEGFLSEFKEEIEHNIKEGWCKWQIRRDWNDFEGEAIGGYLVEETSNRPATPDGKPQPGWFPVWLIRADYWYY